MPGSKMRRSYRTPQSPRDEAHRMTRIIYIVIKKKAMRMAHPRRQEIGDLLVMDGRDIAMRTTTTSCGDVWDPEYSGTLPE